MKYLLISELENYKKTLQNRLEDTTDIDMTIKYLKTGEIPDNYNDYHTLKSAVNDIELLGINYGIYKGKLI